MNPVRTPGRTGQPPVGRGAAVGGVAAGELVGDGLAVGELLGAVGLPAGELVGTVGLPGVAVTVTDVKLPASGLGLGSAVADG